MKFCVWIYIALVAFVFAVNPRLARAQASEALSIEDLLDSQEFAQLSTPVLSPDQELLIYAAKRKPSRIPSSAATSNISSYWRDVDFYALNTRTLESKCITSGVGGNGAPVWSPDGRYLAFLSDRNESRVPNLWIWERSTNRLRKISDVHVNSFEVHWRNNTEVVLTVPAETAPLPPESSTQVRHEAASASQQPTVSVLRSDAVRGGAGMQLSPPWDLDGYINDLASIDIRTGVVQRLTRNTRVGKFVVSPDGNLMAFSSPVRFERPGSQQIRWDLIAITLATKEQHKLASDVRLEYDGSSLSWSPDSSKLAYLVGGSLEHQDPNARGDLFVVELKTWTTRNISNFTSPPSRWKQRAPLWSEDGDALYFIRNQALWKAGEGLAPQELSRIENHRIMEVAATERRTVWSPDGSSITVLTYDEVTKRSGLYRIDPVTRKATMLREEGCFDCVNTDDHLYVSPHRSKIIYFAEDVAHEPNLWMADANSASTRQLTHLNPQLEKTRMGSSQLVRWHNLEGAELEGSLLLPPDYQSGRTYPLIIWVYSGSQGSDYLNRFGLVGGGAFNMQLLATRGYAVLYPDVPEDVGASMRGIGNAVLPGINRLVDLSIANPNEIGVMGHSFGGYTTLALLVQNERFKAAVEIDGFSNLITSYGELGPNGIAFGTSTAEQGQQKLGGTPWQLRDKYIENSPYFYMDKLKSPLLIVHGSKDSAVDPFLADELFVALRRLGKKVEYAKYDGENHSPVYWKYSNQLDFCVRVIDWFNVYLRNTAPRASEGSSARKGQ